MSVHTCPICGKEYKDGRQLHGHLMRIHEAEYRAADFKKENLKQQPSKKKPEGFRLLKKSDPDEAYAYEQGYRYIDEEDIAYTHDEAQQEGWI